MNRYIDCFLSFAGIVLLWPFLFLAGIAIRFNSRGAVIFAQTRVGKNLKEFTCYKLRTMTVGTPEAGTHEVSSASVTSVGRLLRATKFDEMPQLWNVLKGDMSIIGPRPCLPVQKELIHEREKLGVYRILPGITGLAQVEGIDMSDPVKLSKRDADYIAQKSVVLDCKILLWTLIGRGSGDRVDNGGQDRKESS